MAVKKRTAADKKRTRGQPLKLRRWAVAAVNIDKLLQEKNIAKSEVPVLLRQNEYRVRGERQMRRFLNGRACPADADALIWAFAAIFADRDNRELPVDQKRREYHRKIVESTGPHNLMAARDSKTELGDSSQNNLSISEHEPTQGANLDSTSISPLVLKALLHDEDAEAFRVMKDLDYNQAPSFGRIFQIRNWVLPHIQISENGLAPSEIAIDPPLEAFSNFEPSIVDRATVENLTARREFDGKKVSLAGLLPRQDVSDENLRAVRLVTAESTYFLNMGALATIKNDRQVRHQNMSLNPENHTIPNAISIHYIVRFSDKKFLASHRAKSMAYDPERISFTGNEQLKPEDFIDDRPLDRWLFRSLLEEVFRLRKYAPESPEALAAKSQIASGRFLSLYLEEKVGNFGLVCFVQLKISSEQFVARYYVRQLKSTIGEDREGDPYLLTEEDLLKFFQTGKCEFKGLTNDKRLLSVAVDGLEAHKSEVLWRLESSSLYRMWLAGQLVGVLRF